ncbi:MAG: hypothetical protein IPM45_05025 [Acidimicrobiales bacterium]|nr:hypothetical protein [Acidimicrobiales bacterium]
MLRYVAYHELAGVPNVIVDGAAGPDTVLTLSHWPGAATPPALRADLSAEIAFRYLDRPDLHVAAEAVSNNHLDEDGLVSLFALVDPVAATPRRARLVEVARAGDFAVTRDEQAARIAFALAALMDGERSTLDPSLFALPHPLGMAALTGELLGVLAELTDHPERRRDLWAPEHAWLEASGRALADGRARLTEHPDLDLVEVDIDDDLELTGALGGGYGPLHPMAVHRASPCVRVLTRQGARYELRERYEGWVQLVSRRPRPRVDLGPVAAALSLDEPAGRWVADAPSDLTPALHLEGAAGSALPFERFRSAVLARVRDGRPAWDPSAPP